MSWIRGLGITSMKRVNSFIVVGHPSVTSHGLLESLCVKTCQPPVCLATRGGNRRHPVHTHEHTHTVHMALVGYLIVFIVTKCGQTIEFLLWGTIVPFNFLVGYHCSIVASTPQPMAYAFTRFRERCQP